MTPPRAESRGLGPPGAADPPGVSTEARGPRRALGSGHQDAASPPALALRPPFAPAALGPSPLCSERIGKRLPFIRGRF